MSTLKPALPRTESALGQNRAKNGSNSYYFAHGEEWEVPESAIVRAGPGLVTGGAPVPLGKDGEPVAAEGDGEQEDEVRDEVIRQLRARISALETELARSRASQTLSQFSFSDEGAKCKVYVEAGSDVLDPVEEGDAGEVHRSEAGVAVTFAEKSCSLRVCVPRPDGVIGERRSVTLVCPGEIVPESCTFKVDRAKGRITLTLKKLKETKWTKITTSAM